MIIMKREREREREREMMMMMMMGFIGNLRKSVETGI